MFTLSNHILLGQSNQTMQPLSDDDQDNTMMERYEEDGDDEGVVYNSDDDVDNSVADEEGGEQEEESREQEEVQVPATPVDPLPKKKNEGRLLASSSKCLDQRYK